MKRNCEKTNYEKMDNAYDDQTINFDQEDLIGSCSSGIEDDDDDDEAAYTNEIQIDLDKPNSDSLNLVDSATDWNATAQHEHKIAHQEHQQRIQHFQKCRKTFLWMILFGIGLMTLSLLLFIVLPLYQRQLEICCKGSNAYGSILFLSPIVTFILGLIAHISSLIYKWNNRIYNLPYMPIKMFLAIAVSSGLAITLYVISSFKRISCHLQDPLKGSALVFSLVFYFFFCKKVMGLQKIFSATTAVVGLFISVDYGLCDEFRCHGNSINKSSPSTGWQGRAFWTLAYCIGIMLWTLHMSLLEGTILMMSSAHKSTLGANNLLTTISRLVSNSDRENLEDLPEIKSSTCNFEKPKPLHLAFWVHLVTLIMLLTLGLIDIVPPPQMEMKSFSQHWIDSGSTFLCHFGISESYIVNHNIKSNETSHLAIKLLLPEDNKKLFNKTNKNLNNKIKRNSQMHVHLDNLHRKINHHFYLPEHERSHMENKHTFRKYKNLTSLKSSRLENGYPKDCGHLILYSWLLILIYVCFVVCVFYFIDISESAVFSVAMITGALPFVGLFWSLFRLDESTGNALLIWAPAITGELICSLLGAPIVFLGLLLLFRSHFSDMLNIRSFRSSDIVYTSINNA